MTAREDLAAVGAQLSKALGELADAINNGTVTDADLQPLRDVAQQLDDLVPDEEPVPPAEPPAEPPA